MDYSNATRSDFYNRRAAKRAKRAKRETKILLLLAVATVLLQAYFVQPY